VGTSPCVKWELKEMKKRETKSFGWTVIQKATKFKLIELKISPTVPH